jgi:hypothetical protein
MARLLVQTAAELQRIRSAQLNHRTVWILEVEGHTLTQLLPEALSLQRAALPALAAVLLAQQQVLVGKRCRGTVTVGGTATLGWTSSEQAAATAWRSQPAGTDQTVLAIALAAPPSSQQAPFQSHRSTCYRVGSGSRSYGARPS